eukprot:IDg3331t1
MTMDRHTDKFETVSCVSEQSYGSSALNADKELRSSVPKNTNTPKAGDAGLYSGICLRLRKDTKYPMLVQSWRLRFARYARGIVEHTFIQFTGERY